MQPWNYSEGMSPELRKVMTSIGAYSLNDTPFRSISPDPSVYATYPKAFRYVYSESKQKVFSKSTFLGTDWSGTRHGANYVSHAIHEDLFPGYPIEYQESPSFIDGVDHDKVSSDVCPEPLSQIDLVLPAQRRVSRATVDAFIRENGLDSVRRLLRIAVLAPGKILVSDAHDRIPFWIGALTMSLPCVLAEQVSFSTFGNMMDLKTPYLVPRYTETAGFHIVSPTSVPDSPILDEYCDRVYGEPGFLDGFTDFLSRCRLGTPAISALPQYYTMYLVSKGDGSHKRFVTDEWVTQTLSREPKKYEESVLYNNLKVRLENSPDDTVFDLYVRCRDVLVDQNHAAVLKSLYTKLMYAKMRSVTSPEAMAKDAEEYGNVLASCMEAGYSISMDTPGEVYTALLRWSRDRDPGMAALLGRADLTSGFDAFVAMMRHGRMDLLEFSSPDCALAEPIKAKLTSIVFSDLDKKTPDEVGRLLDRVFETDMARYGMVFEAVAGIPRFSDLVTKCLSQLPMRGAEYTYSDALNYCYGLEKCPFISIFKSFMTPQRNMNMSNAQVREAVVKFNDSINIRDPAPDVPAICNAIIDTYGGYDEVLEDGYNRIQAVAFVQSVKAGNISPMDGWSYIPEISEMRGFVRTISPDLAKTVDVDSMIALIRMFDGGGEDFVNSFVDYLADNKGDMTSPKPYIAAAVALLRTGCSQDSVAHVMNVLGSNRKFRQNDVNGDLREICSDEEMEIIGSLSASDKGKPKMFRPFEPKAQTSGEQDQAPAEKPKIFKPFEPKAQTSGEQDQAPAEKPKKAGLLSRFRK